MIYPHDLIARIEALEAHAKREGQPVYDGAEAARPDERQTLSRLFRCGDDADWPTIIRVARIAMEALQKGST